MRRNGLVIVAFLLTSGSATAQTPLGTRTPLVPAAPPPAPAPAAPGPVPAAATGAVQAPGAPPAPGGNAPAPALAENLRSFDPQTAELTWSDRHWRLTAGGAALKDFGPHEAEARQALRLIRDLHLNQYGTVGGPEPVMEYWLSDGHAPQGLAGRLRTLPFDAAGLRVEPFQGQWCLRDSQRILFNFGQRAADARQALGVVRKYGFTQVGMVGQASPTMLVFLGRQGDQPGAGPGLPSTRVHPTSYGHDPAQPTTRTARDLQARYPGAGLDTVVTPALPPLQSTPRTARRQREPIQGGQTRETLEPRDQHTLRPQPAGGQGESPTRIPFDWRQAQLRREGEAWKLTAGSHMLAEFGHDEAAARQALSAVQHYRFNEHYLVGGPGAHLSYFLVNGQAPRGLMLGVPGQPFQPESVAVQQVGPTWALCAGNQVLLPCGNSPDEARALLAVIHRHQCDHLVRLGGDAAGMTFLVRTR
jgi:hypothetical protein